MIKDAYGLKREYGRECVAMMKRESWKCKGRPRQGVDGAGIGRLCMG